jgi:hypothetical protein
VELLKFTLKGATEPLTTTVLAAPVSSKFTVHPSLYIVRLVPLVAQLAVTASHAPVPEAATVPVQVTTGEMGVALISPE